MSPARTKPSDAEASAVFDRMLNALPPEALAEFTDFRTWCTNADVRFLEYVKQFRPEKASFALKLLSTVSDCRHLVTGVRAYLNSASPTLRAQAALLTARGCQNPTWIREMLQDPSARIRANVVDGMRGWNTDASLAMEALSDPSHRVVGSAAVNLWNIDQNRAKPVLEWLLSHDEGRFRAAGTWALGACGCPSLRPLAEKMRRDPDRCVRWNALRALSAIHRFQAMQESEHGSQGLTAMAGGLLPLSGHLAEGTAEGRMEE
jgi:hypothetical protein